MRFLLFKPLISSSICGPKMSQLSSQGNNAIIWLTYVFLLATGCYIAFRYGRAKDFLSSNGTQRGIPLALNFIASGT